MDKPPLNKTPPGSEEISKKEKEELLEQVEQFEGPDRREIRGDDREPEKDPGVAHS